MTACALLLLCAATCQRQRMEAGQAGEADGDACGCGEDAAERTSLDGAAPAPAPDLTSLSTPGAFANAGFRAQAAASLFFSPPTRVRAHARHAFSGEQWMLFHKLDTVFQRPKAFMNVALVTSARSEEPVAAELLLRLANHRLQQQMFVSAASRSAACLACRCVPAQAQFRSNAMSLSVAVAVSRPSLPSPP